MAFVFVRIVIKIKGKIADVFGPGMHLLKTSNLPIMSQLLAWPYGFKSPFIADVFFVNTIAFSSDGVMGGAFA